MGPPRRQREKDAASSDAGERARRVREVRKRIRKGGYDSREVLDELVNKIFDQVHDEEGPA